MARVSIDETAWSGFEVVAHLMGWEFPEFAAGFVAKFWNTTQKLSVAKFEAAEIGKYVGFKIDGQKFFSALKEAGFVEPCNDGRWLISGNFRHIRGLKRKKETNKKYYERKKEEQKLVQDQEHTKSDDLKTVLRSNSDQSVSDSVSGTDSVSSNITSPAGSKELRKKIRQMYLVSIKTRYGVEPPGNAKLNSQVAQLEKRLGQEAVAVVKFFVAQPDQFYQSRMHDIGLCVKDAEALFLRMKSGVSPSTSPRGSPATFAQQRNQNLRDAKQRSDQWEIVDENNGQGKIEA